MRTCLVGLPDSGKSTALAALWFSVKERSQACDWYLTNSDIPDNASRWSTLRDLWLQGKALKRTEHKPSPEMMKLKLTSHEGDKKLTITVPDIAGEDYEKLYESGLFPKIHSERLVKSEHLVFFVHVNDYDHPVVIHAPHEQSNHTEKNESEIQEWKPGKMHPGSKIIAILRGIKQLRGGVFPKITVVLTAWDLIPENSSPEEILNQRFPLLAQYLRTNFEFDLLGLSSQGCDYDDQKPLEGVDLDEIERITVTTSKGEIHNDITKIFA